MAFTATLNWLYRFITQLGSTGSHHLPQKSWREYLTRWMQMATAPLRWKNSPPDSRLHGQSPLAPEELERVFDTLDADGNGSLTLEEFTTGFSQFLSGRKESLAEARGTGTSFHPKAKGSVAEGHEEEEQFSNLMERLGAGSILKDKMSAYDDEIQRLYEEMEQQIKTEKEKVVLEGTEKFQSRHQELEKKLVEKEKELEQLFQKQKTLDKQCKELRNVRSDTTTENTKLRVTNQELLNSLERTSEELIIAQQQLQILQDEAKNLQEEKEIEVCRVTEILEREKLGLLKQLDFLRERNKHLSDQRDVCLQQKFGHEAPVSRKQRSGSIIGKYLERGSSKSEPSEDETFSASQIRSSQSGNVDLSLDSEPHKPGGQIQRKPFRRLISIEEDHLPHLLIRSERQLIGWSEEDGGEPGPGVNGSQRQPPAEQCHASSREEPVGKETLTHVEVLRTAPDRIFKIVLVGNSAVGKTCFLKQFCEERFSPGTAATVGVDYSMKTVNLDSSQVVLQLWDTAGQERYRSITKQFFRKADGVIVMYDVTAQDTFVSVKQWMVSVEEAAGENIPVLLLGNKIDKEEEREVPKRLGERLAKDYHSIFYECSALTGENTRASVLHLARILKEQEDNVKEKTIQLQQQPKKTTCCSRQ
ncbi:EF-hand calcium-binding domain-containing protein 4B [Protobothrops mucrosquamatus]|uniref:EF-hand calcium-binding domain-containing protein 4B n=1 Tax=Protobothrops mucrosquamatus TaxID=103944 RepID=UPI0007757795|nr:EF-hand calcium-binding domain-containing protein 4B [Protobothrops mucrosquamatus]